MRRIGIPYFGKPSHKLAKRLSALVKTKFQIDLSFYYTSFKTGSYFNLKCLTPHALLSNVVYKFRRSHDVTISYIGMTTRHLGIRANEHLNLQLNLKNTAVKDHILTCEKCKSESLTVNNFKVVKKCNSRSVFYFCTVKVNRTQQCRNSTRTRPTNGYKKGKKQQTIKVVTCQQ